MIGAQSSRQWARGAVGLRDLVRIAGEMLRE